MENLIQKITDYVTGDRFIIAVDGRCGAGKSTLAKMLAESLDAPVIHTDDFFLPESMRTEERLAEAGGNMDRERLRDEVLLPLREKGTCAYKRYDCGADDFTYEIVIPESRVYIVEGSYSCHPELWELYDLHVFLSVDENEQCWRILKRNGARKMLDFHRLWMPLEEKYFEAFGIAEKCEIMFDMTDVKIKGKGNMNTLDTLYARKSVRQYTGEPITDSELAEILKSANAAPVGRARYDYLHLTVITDEDYIARWESACGGHPFYGAPTVILVSSEMDGTPEQDNVRYSNAAIVVQNMAIAATALGIGSCHIWGAVRTLNVTPELLTELDLPEGKVPLCAMILGKTDEEYDVRTIPVRIDVSYK